jgi:hypothetical protein
LWRVTSAHALLLAYLKEHSQGFTAMGSLLETVALFCLKLVHETEGQSPILRDDLIMSDYHFDVFEWLVGKGDVAAIQQKIQECLRQALSALGGAGKPLGRELQRLSVDFEHANTVQELDLPLVAIKDYLRAIQ